MYSIRMHTRSHYANNEHRLVCSKIASLKCAHCSLSMYTCTVYVNYVDYDNGFDYICTFHIQCERSGAGVEMHEPSKKLYGLTFLSQCFAISLSVCMCVSVSSVFFSTFIFGRVFFALSFQLHAQKEFSFPCSHFLVTNIFIFIRATYSYEL